MERNDNDNWKDDFLVREYIPGIEILNMDAIRREWLYKYPNIFVPTIHHDGLVNLLHPNNKINAPRKS